MPINRRTTMHVEFGRNSIARGFVRLGSVCALALTLLSAGGLGAAAQAAESANWWDQIPGFGPQTYSRPPSEAPQPDPMDDLRPDSTPWRSDVMIEAIERAIEQYQKIVSAGG
jgi:hypothetical protein